jgi:signal transduction histidine kinase
MQFPAFAKSSTLNRLPQAPVFLAAVFGFLVVAILASMALLERSAQFRQDIEAQQLTQSRADRVLALLRRMESGQRGYLLTADREFLGVYHETEPLMPGALSDLRGDIVDTPEGLALWGRVEPIVASKLAEMTESLRLFDSGDRTGAIALVSGAAGLRAMEETRAIVQQIKDLERLKLDNDYADARQQEWLLLGVNVVAVLLIIGVALISIMIVRRANSAMEKAQSVLHGVNAELEANVAARTAELRTANDEIQKFAYIVSHDLRSPLVNIMGFTSELDALRSQLFQKMADLRAERKNGSTPSMAKAAPLTPDEQIIADDFEEALGFIKASTTKMDRLINAVLTISREGNRTLRPEAVDMSALLLTMSQAMAHQAQATGAKVDIGALPEIVSDRLALEQIFSNLLDNALKYLRTDRPGEIRVKGRAEGNRVIIEVEDNGRGIEQRDQERVFELFRRAGPQDRPGEGMGLAHVRALVRRLGGVIHLKSTPGLGSTFIVTLPRALQQTSKRTSA